jgi:hypothetical protein
VLNRMYLLLGAVTLVLCVGPPTALAQQDSTGAGTSTPGMTSGSGMMGTEMRRVDWSRRYQLTPIEHKRLRALGLTDDEVFAAANVARLTGRPLDAPAFDDPAQMFLRGREMWQVAREFNIPTDDLDNRQPEWETAEWQTAVDQGWFTHHQGSTTTTMERQRTTIETTPGER